MVGMLIVFLMVLWVMVFLLSYFLCWDMEVMIFVQQFLIILLIVSEIDCLIGERLGMVVFIVGKLLGVIFNSVNGDKVQVYFDQCDVFESVFNWGIIVVDVCGVIVVSILMYFNWCGVDFSYYLGVGEVLVGQCIYIIDFLFSEFS